MASNSLIKKYEYKGQSNETALNNELIRVSKQYPKNAVLCFGNFGEPKIYIYKTVASVPVDSMASRSMLELHGGFYVNGKIVKPTRGWNRKQTLADKANCDY